MYWGVPPSARNWTGVSKSKWHGWPGTRLTGVEALVSLGPNWLGARAPGVGQARSPVPVIRLGSANSTTSLGGPGTQSKLPPLKPPESAAAGGAQATRPASASTDARRWRRLTPSTSSRVAQRGQLLPARRRRAVEVRGQHPDVADQGAVADLTADQLQDRRAVGDPGLHRPVPPCVDPVGLRRTGGVEEDGIGLPGVLRALDGRLQALGHGPHHEPVERL